jgi:hypothetical protein
MCSSSRDKNIADIRIFLSTTAGAFRHKKYLSSPRVLHAHLSLRFLLNSNHVIDDDGDGTCLVVFPEEIPKNWRGIYFQNMLLVLNVIPVICDRRHAGASR